MRTRLLQKGKSLEPTLEPPAWISIAFASVAAFTALYVIQLVYSDVNRFNDWLFHVTYTIAAGVPTLLGTYYGAIHLHEWQRRRERVDELKRMAKNLDQFRQHISRTLKALVRGLESLPGRSGQSTEEFLESLEQSEAYQLAFGQPENGIHMLRLLMEENDVPYSDEISALANQYEEYVKRYASGIAYILNPDAPGMNTKASTATRLEMSRGMLRNRLVELEQHFRPAPLA